MNNWQNKMISVVVPAFNEGKYIGNCIESLSLQKREKIELIVIDDGSQDDTFQVAKKVLKRCKNKFFRTSILRVPHSGPGVCRNIGALRASGSVLVFVDADMEFDTLFISELVAPIFGRKEKGTFSKSELLANNNNAWAVCWNIGRYSAAKVYSPRFFKEMTVSKDNTGGVFRAIVKSEFLRVGGFESGGDYSDDVSLYRKLGYKASSVEGATIYHYNPSTLMEIWHRARWIGSGQYFTKGRLNLVKNLFVFSLPVSFFKSVIIATKFKYPIFILFKVFYDFAVWTSVLKKIL